MTISEHTLTAPIASCRTLFTSPHQGFCIQKIKGFRWLLFSLLISTSTAAQNTGQYSRNNLEHAEGSAETPTSHAVIRYTPNKRRDPFINPLQGQKKSAQSDKETARRLPAQGIAGTSIAELIFKGTSFRDDRRLAIVRGADERICFLEEGARFLDGYLKTIQPDSIILVRETKLKSGEILAHDVVKQLRKP